MSAATKVYSATSPEAARYRSILDKKIAEGARSAAATIERIQTEVPVDKLVNTRKLDFEAGSNGLAVRVGDEMLRPSDFAMGQIAGKAGVPAQYLRELAAPTAEPWQHTLAAEILRESYHNRDAERMLTRAVHGQLRAMLSDKFRRLDARPLMEALIGEMDKVGAVPYMGTATDTRVALKALLPKIIEPVEGEFVVLGCEWSTSDYGNGTHRLSQFGLRVACLNGMTSESVLREVHLGSRLSDRIEYSNRTYALDTKASVSALKDTVKGVLGPRAEERLVAEIREANERKYSVAQLKNATKSVGAKVQKAIVDAFESEDVINMPAGETAWRASNAISWLAKNADDETKLDLERLAGKVAAG